MNLGTKIIFFGWGVGDGVLIPKTFLICNFIRKTQKLDNLSVVLTVSNKLQSNLEISSNFVAFLENLNYHGSKSKQVKF